MKQQIDNLIYNALGEGREVYLPQVGTLMVLRRPATMNSSKRLAAPRCEVTFTGEKRGDSIVDIIAFVAKVSQERAEDIYAQWLQLSRRDDVVTINGVGTIRERHVEVDEAFASYLNPERGRVVVLKPRRNWVFYVLASLCILFALAVAGYTLYSEQLFAQRMDKQSLVAEQTKSEAPAEASETVVTTEPIQSQSAEPAQQSSVQEVSEPKTELEPVPMKSGYSYAVWGVYSELKNAKYYVKVVSERYIDLKPCIYLYKGRYMVAVFERKSRGECAELVDRLKELSSSFRDMWIYTNR